MYFCFTLCKFLIAVFELVYRPVTCYITVTLYGVFCVLSVSRVLRLNSAFEEAGTDCIWLRCSLCLFMCTGAFLPLSWVDDPQGEICWFEIRVRLGDVPWNPVIFQGD